MVRWDVIVVGGGPGGMSAALWAHRLELRVVLVDASTQLGGQLLDVHGPVMDYLGIAAANGRGLSAPMAAHLEGLGVPVRLEAPAERIQCRGPAVYVGGVWLEADAVILATGARRRSLGLPSERRLAGRGVSDSATRDPSMFRGRSSLVVGGGDAALENALILARECPAVWVASRGPVRARAMFRERVATEPKITLLEGVEVEEIHGDAWVEGVDLRGPAGRFSLDVSGVCVRIGTAPGSELVAGQVVRDPQGFIEVDAWQRTSAPGIYAVGDVANPHHASVSAAVGQGMVAAKDLSLLKEAGGVPDERGWQRSGMRQ